MNSFPRLRSQQPVQAALHVAIVGSAVLAGVEAEAQRLATVLRSRGHAVVTFLAAQADWDSGGIHEAQAGPAGQIDLVVEAGLQTYDVMAPIAVIQAAGGIVTDWQGGPAHSGGQVLAAANREIHAAALQVLNGA